MDNFKIIRAITKDGESTEMEFMVDSVGQGREVAEELKKYEKEGEHKVEYKLFENTITGWTEWVDEDGLKLDEVVSGNDKITGNTANTENSEKTQKESERAGNEDGRLNE